MTLTMAEIIAPSGEIASKESETKRRKTKSYNYGCQYCFTLENANTHIIEPGVPKTPQTLMTNVNDTVK